MYMATVWFKKDKVAAIVADQVNKLIADRGFKGEKLDFKIKEIINLVGLLEEIKKGENTSNVR